MSDAPEADRVDGAPHPRETARLFGQNDAIAGFLEAFNAGRLHSGWLLTGPRGVGKATLAWQIATFLLATPAQEDAGLFGAPPPVTSLAIPPDHPDARLVQSGAHPRLYVARRQVNDKTGALQSIINVDVIRGIKAFFHLSATDGGRRVVIVDSADDLNPSAANALLKELEEPPANTTILLVAHQPSRLLPTIRSRCRVLRLAPLGAADLQAALAQAGHTATAPDALAALADGSVGDALRLLNHDGLALYAELVHLLDGIPQINRPAAIKLAESCAGRGSEERFALLCDLIDRVMARLARAGLWGEPTVQGAPGEARLLARLAPHDLAARTWADLHQRAGARLRHGAAVNLDHAALILDILFQIEQAALAATTPA